MRIKRDRQGTAPHLIIRSLNHQTNTSSREAKLLPSLLHRAHVPEPSRDRRPLSRARIPQEGLPP